MTGNDRSDHLDVVLLTRSVVRAFVLHNSVRWEELPGIIRGVGGAFDDIRERKDPVAEKKSGKPTPAQIRRSITDTALISFENGKPYAMLKRHLTFRGLTPVEYKQKWGLPSDYPMVAPHYTTKRAELAYRTGLGRNKDKKAAPLKRGDVK